MFGDCRKGSQAVAPLHGFTHLFLSHGSEYLLNYIKLVNLTFPREHRLAVTQLPHDTAYRPHVHLVRVARAPQQELRGPVPPRGHVVRQRLTGGGHGAGETEVAQLEGGGSGVDKEVLGLDIAVDYVLAVAEGEGITELKNVLRGRWRGRCVCACVCVCVCVRIRKAGQILVPPIWPSSILTVLTKSGASPAEFSSSTSRRFCWTYSNTR